MEAHPTVWFATRLHQVLDEVVTGSAAGLDGTSAADAAVLVARAESRLSALRLRLLDQARREEDSSAEQAVSEGWWADASSVDHRRARKDFKVASWLNADFHRTEAALAAGEVTQAQAEAIVDAVRALPASVGPEGREKAEQHLLEQAGDFGPKKLKVLGKHLVDVIDPDAAEARLAAQLEAEERAAQRSCFLKVYADEHGTTHVKGAIPTLAGDQLLTTLNAFASPRRPEAYAREDATGRLALRPAPHRSPRHPLHHHPTTRRPTPLHPHPDLSRPSPETARAAARVTPGISDGSRWQRPADRERTWRARAVATASPPPVTSWWVRTHRWWWC